MAKLLILVALALFGHATSSAVTAERNLMRVWMKTKEHALARSWLKAHNNEPNGDDMAELAKADPASYAIVQALLVKQQAGLLNVKHPSVPLASAQQQDLARFIDTAVVSQIAADRWQRLYQFPVQPLPGLYQIDFISNRILSTHINSPGRRRRLNPGFPLSFDRISELLIFYQN